MRARDVRIIGHAHMPRRRDLERAANGIRIDWTRRAGDIARMTRRALEDGCGRVVIAGGDGSINEAVNVLHGTGACLGIIPGGTGNDLARMLKIPAEPAAAIRVALDSKPRKLDLARIQFSDGRERLFINIAEAGFGATAVARMEKIGRLAGRTLAYPLGILAALAAYRTVPVTLRLDGREMRIPRLSNLVVANGRYFGRGLQPAPDARPDDGELDVLVMRDLSHADIAVKAPKLKNGPPKDDPRLRTYRARKIEVEGPQSVLVEADGEIPGNLPACIVVIDHGLDVAAPRDL